MSSNSTHSDHLSSINPAFTKSVSNRTRSKVSIPDLGEPQNILIRLPTEQERILNSPNFIDLGDDWPSDEEEVSKPEVPNCEEDDEPEPEVERDLYRAEITPYCEKTDSIMTLSRLEKLYEECPRPTCTIAIPGPGERAHSFNVRTPELGIPKAVISAAFFKVGVYVPLHPFIREILDFYELAPLQLTPNSYRLAICTYILYASKFTTPLTAKELGYFFKLKDTGRSSGCFYLSAWPCHQGQCIKNVKQNFEQWPEQFLYCYGCPEVRYEFNRRPRIPKQTPLTGNRLLRAQEILKLSSSIRDCLILMTPKNLTPLGFLPSDLGMSFHIVILSAFDYNFVNISVYFMYASLILTC